MLQGIFSLLNSKTYKQIKISEILIDDFILTNLNKVEANNNKSLINQASQCSIENIDLNEQKIIYTLKGIISSDKNFQKSIKKIKTKKEFLNGILYIKHYVEIEKKNRKEHNPICHYSYTKDEKSKLPKNLISIKIELFEGIISPKKQINYSLTAEKYITI